MSFDELPEFKKECKQLKKKYRSIPGDLGVFRKVVSASPLGNGKHFVVITQTECVKIVKARFFCRYLKGSSLLRIVYAYVEEHGRIDFIEIFFKGQKERENKVRIKEYLKILNAQQKI